MKLVYIAVCCYTAIIMALVITGVAQWVNSYDLGVIVSLPLGLIVGYAVGRLVVKLP